MNNSLHRSFDEHHVLHELKHFLPAQTSLKDFIHHNSLHAYQHLKFYDAIFKASSIFGYQVTLQLTEFRQLYKDGRIKKGILDRIILEKGADQLAVWTDKLLSKQYDTVRTQRIGSLRAHWNSEFHINLDGLVQPLFFRILCGYLDQGISLWRFPKIYRWLFSFAKSIRKKWFYELF